MLKNGPFLSYRRFKKRYFFEKKVRFNFLSAGEEVVKVCFALSLHDHQPSSRKSTDVN